MKILKPRILVRGREGGREGGREEDKWMSDR